MHMESNTPQPMDAEHYDARLKRIQKRLDAANAKHAAMRRELLRFVSSCELAFAESCDAAVQLEHFKSAYIRQEP